jgi:hypothetical protein
MSSGSEHVRYEGPRRIATRVSRLALVAKCDRVPSVTHGLGDRCADERGDARCAENEVTASPNHPGLGPGVKATRGLGPRNVSLEGIPGLMERGFGSTKRS